MIILEEKTFKIKSYPFNSNLINVLLLCILIFVGGWVGSNFDSSEEHMPLLLNSGLTKSELAEVRITIWFEGIVPPESLKRHLPHQGWEWQESDVSTTDKTYAYSLSGYTRLNKEEESKLYSWFLELYHEVTHYGGRVYLDERVPEQIDIAKYSVLNGISPVQWSLSEGVFSLAGFKKELNPGVKAGSNMVNVQLISKFQNNVGKTALVFPVLLEEF